jgi:hypothetical protein
MKKWINLSLVAAILALSMTGQSQNDSIQRYFEKYMSDERFDMVYISPKMFSMVSKIELESDQIDPDVMDIIKELKGLRILSYDGPEAPTFYKEAKTKINLNEYEELIVARDGDEQIHIRVKESGDIVSELILLVGGTNEFALISFIGNVDLKKIGKLAKILDIDHIQELERIDKKKQ